MNSGKIKSTYYVRLPKELIGLYNQMITKQFFAVDYISY